MATATSKISEHEPDDLSLYPDVQELRIAYFRAVPEICVERSENITTYHLENGLFKKDKISALDKAKAYRYALSKRQPIVRHSSAPDKNKDDYQRFPFVDLSPFAGSTTSKFKGVILYPELFGLVMWPELNTVFDRRPNPFYLSPKDAEKLNHKIFPHWMEKTVWEITRRRYYENQFHDPIVTDYPDEMKLLQNVVFFLNAKAICISHCIPSFSEALGLGLAEMINRAETRKKKETDPQKADFHQSSIEILHGIIEYSKKLSVEAHRLSEVEHDPNKKRKLLEIAEIYDRVPESKATTFREALTTIWICWTALHLESPNIGLSLGRLDQLLYPYYCRDLNGSDSKNKEEFDHTVTELLCYFWLKIGDHVPTMLEAGEKLFGGTGSNQAVTIGGVDRKGNDAVNNVTYLMLKAASLVKLRDPNLAARYHPEKNPPDYIERLTRANIDTGAIPAIYNDKAIIEALCSKGDEVEDARDYGIVGCVEPVSAGRTFGHNAAVILNLASALELTLFNGKHRHTGTTKISAPSGNPSDFKKFSDFWEAFETQTSWLIHRATTLNYQLGRVHQDFYPTPILSTFFEGPSEKGQDVTHGGAKINFSGATIIGLADVVDSISAIKKWVFQKGNYSFSRLLRALRDNFQGREHAAMWALFKNPDQTPKFGNDDPFADKIAVDVVELLDNKFKAIKNYRDSNYRVGYWTMTFHAGMGVFMPSLPNGRLAKESFASGITPVSNVSNYLTKSLNSISKLPPKALSSGAALNIKLFPESDAHLMSKNLAAAIDTFFGKNSKEKTGGLQIQFIVKSGDQLKKAMLRPEKHSDLLVRVSGYSAYFVDLNSDMQREILARTEYVVSNGYSNPCGLREDMDD